MLNDRSDIEVIKRDWPALSSFGLNSYLPKAQNTLSSKKHFADYPSRPVHINSAYLNMNYVKKNLHKLVRNQERIIEVQKSKLQSLKKSLLRRKILENLTSSIHIVDDDDREHPLTTNFSVYY